MKPTSALALLSLALSAATAYSQEIVPGPVLGTPVGSLSQGWNGHVDFVHWVGVDVICGYRNGEARRCSISTKQPRWTIKPGPGRADTEFAFSSDHIYRLARHPSQFGANVEVYRVADGAKIVSFSPEHLKNQAGDSSFLASQIYWCSPQQLLVTRFAEAYGENGIFLNTTPLKKTDWMNCDGFVTDVSDDPSGRFITTISNLDNIRIWDRTEGKEVFKLGNDKESPIDARFFSNAQFDGHRLLVYTRDNSWRTGRVMVHDIIENKQLAEFESRNGHVVMDVDFTRGWIALTGTERGLTVVDLTGKTIAILPSVALQRNAAIAFSADASRLAIGSWDNTIRTFEVREATKK